MDEDFELTKEQLKAVKSVERAMKKAAKMGVEFWDNYGSMTAYNACKITLPVPDNRKAFSLWDHDVTVEVNASNFHAGNADDELYFDKCAG